MNWIQLFILCGTLFSCTIMICLAMPSSARTTSIEIKLQKISSYLERIATALEGSKL